MTEMGWVDPAALLKTAGADASASRAAMRIQRLAERSGQEPRVFYGVVTAVSSPTITVTARGVSIPGVPFLDTLPAIGSLVALLQTDGAYLCIGEVGADSGWQTPTYDTGWADWSDTVNTLPRYQKVSGLVTVQGVVRRTSGAGGTIFTALPTAFRPSRQEIRPCVVNGVPAVCSVTAAGVVGMITGVTNGHYVSLFIQYYPDAP